MGVGGLIAVAARATGPAETKRRQGVFRRVCILGLPGYLPEYDRNKRGYPSRVFTLGAPGYLPKDDHNNQVCYPVTPVGYVLYPGTYPSIIITTRFATRVAQ